MLARVAENLYWLGRYLERADNVAYMLDQNHNVEGKLEAQVVSIINCQSAYAKCDSARIAFIPKGAEVGSLSAARSALRV